MKQYITPKQAMELTKEQFYSLIPGLVDRKDWEHYHHNKITIGKMLEILKGKQIPLTIRLMFYKPTEECEPFETLCDVLWDEIKTCLGVK